ncbi:MAG: phosphodiester glycosidase family protein, partial [Firmicutes bacterium]|nr:phosphodiester glycosidase family protein [Bacillota bacterium]
MPRKRLAACAQAFIAFLALAFVLCSPLPADAYQLIGQTSEEEKLTRGATLLTVHLKTGDGPINVYVVKADLTDPYLKVDTIVGATGTLDKNQAVSAMAGRAGAVAAVNGDFFQMNDSGRPIGLLYQGGRLFASPALRTDMFGLALTKDKTPVIDIFGFSGQLKAQNGKTFPIAGINKPNYLVMSEQSSDKDSLQMYTPLWGSTSRGKLSHLSGVVEVVVQGGVVRQVLTDRPGVPIPPDGFVLQGHGQAAKFLLENCPAGTKVEASYSVTPAGDKLFAAVGGQALLVEDGHLPAYFSQNISGNHARTAAGFSKDGKTFYLVAVEKAVLPDGTVVSRGMSQEELASYLISLGVWRAVNLDGGGSTTLAARHTGDFSPELVNRPQNGSQRPVPDAVGIFSTAPAGTLA